MRARLLGQGGGRWGGGRHSDGEALDKVHRSAEVLGVLLHGGDQGSRALRRGRQGLAP